MIVRRLIALGLLALATVGTAGAAAAEPRIGPPLQLQIVDFVGGGPDGADEVTLYVTGRGCLPQDAPASVVVTVDRFPGQVFTAAPRVSGRWQVQIALDTPLDGVWVVNATCDNYFGTTVYPQAQINADQVVYAVADGELGGGGEGSGGGEGGTDTTTGVANTGSRTRAELAVGVAAVLLGALLLVIARPRGAVAHARSHASGRHRR